MSEPRAAHAVSNPELEGWAKRTGLESTEESSTLRLPCCGNLRGSTPKHKPDCRRASENCPGCLDAAQRHLASCRRAVFCCSGIDSPEVGFVHAADCPLSPCHVTTLDGIRSRAFPEAFRAILREGLLARLLFDSRNLALSRLRDQGFPFVGRQCLECGGSESPNIRLHHHASCLVGGVLKLVDELIAPDPTSVGKEAAQTSEIVEDAGAGTGNPRAGAYGEPWRCRSDYVLDRVRVYDCEGTLIANLGGRPMRELEDWAYRIVDAVNFCSPQEEIPLEDGARKVIAAMSARNEFGAKGGAA